MLNGTSGVSFIHNLNNQQMFFILRERFPIRNAWTLPSARWFLPSGAVPAAEVRRAAHQPDNALSVICWLASYHHLFHTPARFASPLTERRQPKPAFRSNTVSAKISISEENSLRKMSRHRASLLHKESSPPGNNAAGQFTSATGTACAPPKTSHVVRVRRERLALSRKVLPFFEESQRAEDCSGCRIEAIHGFASQHTVVQPRLLSGSNSSSSISLLASPHSNGARLLFVRYVTGSIDNTHKRVLRVAAIFLVKASTVSATCSVVFSSF